MCKIKGLRPICDCKKGFKGELCDIRDCEKIDVCSEYGNIFNIKGFCIEETNKHICECDKNWNGSLCNIMNCDDYTGCEEGSK